MERAASGDFLADVHEMGRLASSMFREPTPQAAEAPSKAAHERIRTGDGSSDESEIEDDLPVATKRPRTEASFWSLCQQPSRFRVPNRGG
ncbi:hypothetical protein PAPYR_2226 [Paratrimastix pyriformis]|uniref:Uncharacterized protein n=1 Tax=Paratrimastix pyriformis TaxID=342808 RepID=A0ABQ8UWQ8_9EUKA|nr:hypothetical protein PAPYR_2226 [Paratrimastix pyriformis]